MSNNGDSKVTPANAALPEVTGEAAPKSGKILLLRRTLPDGSQRTRLTVQSAFILLNVFLGAQFYLFVRHFESGAAGAHVSRPAGIDGWLPIAGLMNLRYLLATGHIPAIHPAAMVLFLIFVAMSLLLKRAFCSWLCPVGTLSEYLWKAGRKLFGRNLSLPRWLDIPLRSIKYLLMAFFVVIIGNMTAVALEDFMTQPYGILADVKMLHFFLHMSTAALAVIATLALLSMVVKNFWCRYACPYGAVMSLASLGSPFKIRRDKEGCIECGKCAQACPQDLPVDRVLQVNSVECVACMECVASCSAQNALHFALSPLVAAPLAHRWSGRALRPAAIVIILAVLFFGGVGLARITHHWQTNVSDQAYERLIPHVDDDAHPGF